MRQTLLLLFFASSFALGQSTQPAPADQPVSKQPYVLQPVDKLKATRMISFEPALPQQNFGRWFRRLVAPSVPNYEQRDCDNAAANAKPDAPKSQCIYVTAALPQGKFLSLKFVFDAEHDVYNYVAGSLASSDPQNKQAARTIQKLSELPGLLHPEGQGS